MRVAAAAPGAARWWAKGRQEEGVHRPGQGAPGAAPRMGEVASALRGRARRAAGQQSFCCPYPFRP